MPLCPQITNTPITVTQTTDFTVTSVVPAVANTTDGLAKEFSDIDTNVNNAISTANAAAATAGTAQSTANTALANAATAYSAAIGSLQPSANTIVNSSNQITAINGNGITVYSGASATSGARVVLNSAGLAAFNSSNSATFSLTASTGAAVFSGNVTGATITGSSLNIGGNFIVNGSTGVMTATGATITGTVNATAGYFGTVSNGWSISSTGLVGVGSGTIVGGTIQGSTVTATSGTKSITLNPSTATLNITDSSSGFLSGGGVVITSSGLTGSYGAQALGFGTVTLSNDGSNNALLQTGSNAYIRLRPNAGSPDSTYPVYVEGTFETVGRIQCGGNLNAPNIPSTTSAANVRWTTGGVGQFQYVTSSTMRVKDNITNITNVPGLNPKALLDLPVRAFTYKPEHLGQEDDRFNVMVPGFIAEEVDQIYPIAADYDVSGPINWNDRYIVPAMLALIQDLYHEIDILKGNVLGD